MKVQNQTVHENREALHKSVALPLVIAAVIVLAAGIISALARVEIASPFTSRQAAVQVFFYDVETGEIVNPNPAQLIPLALQRRIGYQAEIYRPRPEFLRVTLQCVLTWLSFWLALGLTVWFFNRSLTIPQWWEIGSTAGWLLVWRLLQSLSISHWLWLPNWRSDLVTALLDLFQGYPIAADLLWAVLWRGLLWLLMGVASFVHIFVVLRRNFNLNIPKALIGLVAVYLLARLIYVLSTGQLWQ
ncbi:MAG: hypothetical protein N3B10_03315 [Armatimonadetes bacterium]|nr:hypothetical protein [Armatimonadota bacterium]